MVTHITPLILTSREELATDPQIFADLLTLDVNPGGRYVILCANIMNLEIVIVGLHVRQLPSCMS